MEKNEVYWEDDHKTLHINLTGRVDAVAAKKLYLQIEKARETYSNPCCIVNAKNLGYIASAGIRILIGLKSRCQDLKIVDVSRDIYDILSMTGITNLVTVERHIRKIQMPAPGMLLRKETDGDVYRETEELVVKLFPPDVALDEVLHRWELSRLAVSNGIPTPIAFEAVSCGDSYGLIYENVHGKTLAEIYRERPDGMQDEVRMLAELMKEIHRCHIPEDMLPDIELRLRKELEETFMLSDEERACLLCVMDSLRRKDAFVYGNLRLQNVLLQDNRLVLLDMTRCGRGSPVLDLQLAASGMRSDGHESIWKRFFAWYTENMDPVSRDKLEKVINPRIRPWW